MDENIANFRLNIEGFDDEIFIDGSDKMCTPHLSAYSASRNLEIAVCYCNPDIAVFIAIPKRHREYNGRFYTYPAMTRYLLADFDPLMVRCAALALAEEYRDFVGDPLPTEVTTHD